MGKLLVLVLLVVVVVWAIRRALRSPAGDSSSQKEPFQGDLVSCARCGLNLPRNEARESSGALFCSEEHAQLGRKDTTAGRS